MQHVASKDLAQFSVDPRGYSGASKLVSGESRCNALVNRQIMATRSLNVLGF